MKKNAIPLRDRIIMYILCHVDPLLTLIEYVLRQKGPSDRHKTVHMFVYIYKKCTTTFRYTE